MHCAKLSRVSNSPATSNDYFYSISHTYLFISRPDRNFNTNFENPSLSTGLPQQHRRQFNSRLVSSSYIINHIFDGQRCYAWQLVAYESFNRQALLAIIQAVVRNDPQRVHGNTSSEESSSVSTHSHTSSSDNGPPSLSTATTISLSRDTKDSLTTSIQGVFHSVPTTRYMSFDGASDWPRSPSQIKNAKSTPPIPAPSISSAFSNSSGIRNTELGRLTDPNIALNFYNLYIASSPGIPISTLDSRCTLSAMPIFAQSFNTGPLLDKYYHHILRATKLHSANSTETIYTVALGRINYEGKATLWVVAMDVNDGEVYALRSDVDAPGELDFDDSDDKQECEHYDVFEGTTTSTEPVPLPEFEGNGGGYCKAVLLGQFSILGGSNGTGSAKDGDKGYIELAVDKWESILVAAD
ncbi:hypothetical protein DL98DRAFT_596933 [Cadophora sp. DSE1049]|nr:hypothetical protein DL98DRAFT_596933 [Cadophora sp. DSE1049]